jgi:hypothetical protein
MKFGYAVVEKKLGKENRVFQCSLIVFGWWDLYIDRPIFSNVWLGGLLELGTSHLVYS